MHNGDERMHVLRSNYLLYTNLKLFPTLSSVKILSLFMPYLTTVAHELHNVHVELPKVQVLLPWSVLSSPECISYTVQTLFPSPLA